MLYTIWRVCERLSLVPPGVKSNFEDNDNEILASLIAYSQVREMEDAEAQNYGQANKV